MFETGAKGERRVHQVPVILCENIIDLKSQLTFILWSIVVIERFGSMSLVRHSICPKKGDHWSDIPLVLKKRGPIGRPSQKLFVTLYCIFMFLFVISWLRSAYTQCLVVKRYCRSTKECQVIDVLFVEDHIFSNKLFTENFDDYHHAFRVLRSEERCLIKMSELKFQSHLIFKAHTVFERNVCRSFLHSQCCNSVVYMTAREKKMLLMKKLLFHYLLQIHYYHFI